MQLLLILNATFDQMCLDTNITYIKEQPGVTGFTGSDLGVDNSARAASKVMYLMYLMLSNVMYVS